MTGVAQKHAIHLELGRKHFEVQGAKYISYPIDFSFNFCKLSIRLIELALPNKYSTEFLVSFIYKHTRGAI